MTPSQPGQIREADRLRKLKEAIAEEDRLSATRRERAIERAYVLPRYDLLAVTAVLTAPESTTVDQAMGELIGGELVPRRPHLRSSTHPPDENYITDWIKLANEQLLISGAAFGLDRAKLVYVEIKSDLLNGRMCGDGSGHGEVRQILDAAAQTEPALDYRKNVILIFRWGTGTLPVVLSCSGLADNNHELPIPAVYMGRYLSRQEDLDGVRVVPSDLLTHEFGHYMGLLHTHPKPVTDKVKEVREQIAKGLDEDQGADALRTWLESYQGRWNWDEEEQRVPGFPISDTPLDLGWGCFKLLQKTALVCSGTSTYLVDSDKHGKVTVTVDDRVRGNVMGSWRCDPAGRVFSADQVDRMHHVLTNHRSQLRRRTFLTYFLKGPKLEATKLDTRWALPPLQRAPRPEEKWKWLKWTLHRWVQGPLGRMANALTGSRRTPVEIETILPEWKPRDVEAVARSWLDAKIEEVSGLEECADL